MKYEIGKVYSWNQPNDGKCPLPEGSTGTVIFRDGHVGAGDDLNEWGWGEGGDYTIVAFIPKYIPEKPLEIWVNIYKDGGMGFSHKTEEGAKSCAGSGGFRTALFREVKEG